MLAQTIKDTVIVIERGSYYDPALGYDNHCIVISNPSNDYDGYRDAPAALEFDGRRYGKSGYNTDRGTISYTTHAMISVAYKG